MCFQQTCQTCMKTTWAGCGQHIDTVSARCECKASRICQERVRLRFKQLQHYSECDTTHNATLRLQQTQRRTRPGLCLLVPVSAPLALFPGPMHMQALRGVPMEDRCKCKPCTQAEQNSKK